MVKRAQLCLVGMKSKAIARIVFFLVQQVVLTSGR